MLLTKVIEGNELKENGLDELIVKKDNFVNKMRLKGYIIIEVTYKRYYLYNSWMFAYIIIYINDN